MISEPPSLRGTFHVKARDSSVMSETCGVPGASGTSVEEKRTNIEDYIMRTFLLLIFIIFCPNFLTTSFFQYNGT